MITNLVHRDTGIFLSIEDSWHDANDVLFVENWWACDCDKVNPVTTHFCDACGESKEEKPDARLSNMWGLLGRVYEHDVKLLASDCDFIVIKQTPAEIAQTASYSRLVSSPIGENSWDIKIWYDVHDLWGERAWIGTRYTIKVNEGVVTDQFEGVVKRWPTEQIADALNYLFEVDLPVASK